MYLFPRDARTNRRAGNEAQIAPDGTYYYGGVRLHAPREASFKDLHATSDAASRLRAYMSRRKRVCYRAEHYVTPNTVLMRVTTRRKRLLIRVRDNRPYIRRELLFPLHTRCPIQRASSFRRRRRRRRFSINDRSIGRTSR